MANPEQSLQEGILLDVLGEFSAVNLQSEMPRSQDLSSLSAVHNLYYCFEGTFGIK